MAKIARASVASNESSLALSNSSNISVANQTLLESSTATRDPLRSSGHQLTTYIIPNSTNNYHENTSAGHSASATNSNNTTDFDTLNSNSTISQNFNSTQGLLATERERIRMEFYATYDVMTGVRIAATLGGFFGLMVFLIVYKSRSHSNETLKVLKDPKIAAVAAACMQEEDERKIQEAIQATGLSIFPDEYDTMLYRRQRMLSVGNVSAPPVLHRGFRFSSVGGGGYSSLLEPHRRYSYSGSRRKSASESSRIISAYPMGSSFGTDDYFVETDDELDNQFDQLSTRDDVTHSNAYLEVPVGGQESRRSSAMTCCSTESSYLERRCSALTLGLTSLPSTFEETSKNRRSSTDMWNYYYPDIQVISATPKSSPCPSERSLYDQTRTSAMKSVDPSITSAFGINENYCPKAHHTNGSCDTKSISNKQLQCIDNKNHQNPSKTSADKNELNLFVKRKISDPSSNKNNSYSNVCNSSYRYDVQHRNEDVQRAPLASISSFKISSIDYQDSDLKSLGSDSVFAESYADTDDDMEQFSTDSDELSLSGDKPVKEESSTPIIKETVPHDEITASRAVELDRLNLKCHYPILEEHRTVSISSNDRDVLISQHPQEQLLVQGDLGTLKFSEVNRIGSHPDILSSPPSLSHRNTTSLPTEETTFTRSTPSIQNTEIQKATTSFSHNNNDSCRSSSKRNSKEVKIYKSKDSKYSDNRNNECVEVNVIIENRSTNIISPSVILELPIMTLPSQDDDPPRDPSLPGTSRKWSKETLF